MDVSVIIVNYNTIAYLVNAIDSIFEKTKNIEFEIIVVDNNSYDNSKYILQEKYGNSITYLTMSKNVGFGQANNKAAEIAKGRNLFLLNPDTILMNNAIKILSDYLDENKLVAVCGGNLFDEKYQPTISFCRMFLPSVIDELNQLIAGIPEKIMYGKNRVFNYTNKPLEVAFITGADMMMKKEIFFTLGGFDKDFFMYHEEIELAYRVHKLKYKLINIPDAHIVHLEGRSILSNIEKLQKKLVSRNLYLYKTHGRSSILIINSLFVLNTVMRFIFFSITGNTEKVAFWSFIMKEILSPPLRST
jgi:GT2 family glycosyltransferase